MQRKLLALVALAVVLAGCATPEKRLEPIVSLAQRTCPATVDFSHALPLQVDAKDTKVTTADVGTDALCFADERGPSTYAVFAIPPLTGQYTIQVASLPANPALFAVRVLLFDKDGVLKRTVMEKQITYRGLGLTAMFRNHDDEQFLVVASDPKIAGGTDSRITGNTTMTTVCTGYSCGNWYSGSEAVTNVVFAHNGKLAVSMVPIPPPSKK